MPTSLIAPIVTGAVGAGLSGMFGGKSTQSLQDFQPTGINAGGLTSTFANGQVQVNPSADRMGAVSNLSDIFGNQANTLGGLASQVAPGNSAFLQSQLAQIENARTSSLSNLKDNLARRRVLGSSFGQDAVSRSEAQFGQAKAEATAQSFLQSIDAQNQLLTQQYAAQRSAVQTGLDEMNLEAGTAMALAGKVTDVLSKNAQLLSALNARSAAGMGRLFGPAASAIGKGASDAFSGAGSFFKSQDFGAASNAAIY